MSGISVNADICVVNVTAEANVSDRDVQDQSLPKRLGSLKNKKMPDLDGNQNYTRFIGRDPDQRTVGFTYF